MLFKEYYNRDMIKLYRGEGSYNKGGNYWSTDREWSRQFTGSGIDSEIREMSIKRDEILILDPLPRATDEKDIEEGIRKSKEGGYRGFMVDEGKGQPVSVFMIEGVL